MKQFEVGDRVFDLQLGNGFVTSIDNNARYPIKAVYDGGYYETYTVGGFPNMECKTAMLYHGHDLQIIVKEQVYEYQILYKIEGQGAWELSGVFYTSYEEFLKSMEFKENVETQFLEITKRVREIKNV